MPYPRAQQMIAGILTDLFKKDYRDEFIVPFPEAHEKMKQRLVGRGLSGEVVSEEFIENSIRKKKNQKGNEYLVEILEICGEPFYGNQRNRWYPIFMELPKYVRSRDYLYKPLPLGIGSRSAKKAHEDAGADLGMILENIKLFNADNEWKWLDKISEDDVLNMMETWNIYCDNGNSPFSVDEGKWYLNIDSTCVPLEYK